ncbi:PREDICTED: F-box/kelch-repeat protein At3g13680-like [Camelina sativa]|uniref:F-box/kelch-repeat protein At3g13680-like n=1 Tax=Camelina sativa TaxID=90675 RepID=A0ABM1QZN2_CAMSA|nr:PREDICTED: F-box/kelch-repeat protein At3g13680-like [Camelina sativa]
MGFLMMDYSVFSMKFDLQGIRGDSVSPSVKQLSVLDQIKVTEILHCDGLLLCVLEDRSRLLLWNPYLGQTMWIHPRKFFDVLDRYAIGYDKNRNHKILRIFGEQETVLGYEIYDLSSSSWSVFDVTPDWECQIPSYERSVSLKGHAYFLAEIVGESMVTDILVYFDFTTERFGPHLVLPSYDYHPVSLSCVREEKLALLYYACEIWITNKIDPYEVSWRKLQCIDHLLVLYGGSFLIDEEENVAVVFDLDNEYKGGHQTAYITGQDGYYKSVNLRETRYFNTPCGEPVAVAPIIGKKAEAARKNQLMGFLTMDNSVFSMKFDLQGIHDDDEDDDSVSPSVKQKAGLPGHA